MNPTVNARSPGIRRAARGARVLCAAALFAGVALTGCQAPPHGGEPRLTPAQRLVNAESFDALWQTVRDRHWDPTLGGVDWEQVRREIRPRIARAQTMSAARRLMRSALERLRQSHCAIIPAEVYDDLRHAGEAEPGDAGFRVRIINDEAFACDVRPGTPADAAGVRAGWRLVEIDGAAVDSVIARVHAQYADSTLRQLMLTTAVSALLSGSIGEPLHIAFENGGDEPCRLTLARVAPRGSVAGFGNMPATHVWFESRPIGDDVGYIAFNAFLDPDRLSQLFEEAIESFRGTRGIVLDLRGNTGGISGMSMGLAGWFVERAGEPLGTMHLREGVLRFAVFPRPNPYRGRLAILVDGCTASTAEILASGLQDLHRARVFGERTSGAALPSMFTRLPNNDGLQYPYADYQSAHGGRLEGVGVFPDQAVVPTRADLFAGRDPVLDAAAAWIRAAADRAQPTTAIDAEPDYHGDGPSEE